MNKYRIHVIFILMLSLIACTIQTRHSRKRYNKKKQSHSNIHTLIDINSTSDNIHNSLQTSSVSALPQTTQFLFSQPQPADNLIDMTYMPLPEEKKVPAPIFEEENEEDSI